MIKAALFENPSKRELPLYAEVGGSESTAYLYLSVSTGQICVGRKLPFDNTVSAEQWHGVLRAYRVPNNLTEYGYNQLMQDESILALCRRIVAGSVVEWDGNNHVALLDDDAIEADWNLEDYAYRIESADYHSLNVWDAYQYYNEAPYNTLVQEGEDHDIAETRLHEEALNRGVYMSHRNLFKVLDYKKEQGA